MKLLFAAAALTIGLAGGAAAACNRPDGAAGVEAELAAWINAQRAGKGKARPSSGTGAGFRLTRAPPR